MNNNGLKAFELNGIDYSIEYYVSRAEGDDVEAEVQTKKKIDIPVGVIIGVLIGTVAVVSGF